MDIFSRLIRNVASCVGITLCSKCLAWTKIQNAGYTEDGDPKGFTICSRCGQKDWWNNNDNVGVG